MRKSRVRFDDVLVGADGHTQVHIGTTPTGSSVQLLNPDGTVRAQLASGGGVSNPDPAAAGVNFYYPNGSNTIMLRVGTAAPLDLPAMTLRDSQGTVRYGVSLDASGNASIQILDADGTVIWSAPLSGDRRQTVTHRQKNPLTTRVPWTKGPTDVMQGGCSALIHPGGRAAIDE